MVEPKENRRAHVGKERATTNGSRTLRGRGVDRPDSRSYVNHFNLISPFSVVYLNYEEFESRVNHFHHAENARGPEPALDGCPNGLHTVSINATGSAMSRVFLSVKFS